MLLGFGLIAGDPMAEPALQPPMNEFDYAFYECANGVAFQMTYDSDTPQR